MKVFLSWSGTRSKAIAEAFAWWLPQAIQAVDPWISSDIDKGARWSPEISSGLETTRVGIICLTRDNLGAPWLLFEAGALSKTRDAYVCTFLLDVKAADVEQPLGQFQHTQFDKLDVARLLETINKTVIGCGERGLSETALSDSFEAWWPRLEQRLKSVSPSGGSVKPQRSVAEVVEEILEIVRGLQRPLRVTAPAEDIAVTPSSEFYTAGVAYAVLLDPATKMTAFLSSLRASSRGANVRVLGRFGNNDWLGVLVYGRGLEGDERRQILAIEGVRDVTFVPNNCSASDVAEIIKTLAEAAS